MNIKDKWIGLFLSSVVLSSGMALEAVVPMSATARSATSGGFETDGCSRPGVDRIPGIANFREACVAHDRCYFNLRQRLQNYRGRIRRRFQAQLGFLECDRRFLSNMRRACRQQHRPGVRRRVACYETANTYYKVVAARTAIGTRRLTP
ncbi:phospholipase A2 [Phormidesmis sp. 146-12]